jgi:hypothetical protein
VRAKAARRVALLEMNPSELGPARKEPNPKLPLLARNPPKRGNMNNNSVPTFNSKFTIFGKRRISHQSVSAPALRTRYMAPRSRLDRRQMT